MPEELSICVLYYYAVSTNCPSPNEYQAIVKGGRKKKIVVLLLLYCTVHHNKIINFSYFE
jgi:hypothetical protein